jgi:WD40 repeat protein
MTKISDSIIASAGDDKSIKVWNLNDFKNIITLKPNPMGSFRSLSYSSDLDIFTAGKFDANLLVWFKFSEIISMNRNSITTTLLNVDLTTKNNSTQTSLFLSLIDETSTFLNPTAISDSNSLSKNETANENEIITSLFSSNESSLISFGSILNPHYSSANDSTNLKLIVDLLNQTKYDLNDCLSNCSNHGKCKLNENKLKCECDLYFDGAKCEIDLRPCSYFPCLNSIKCENILISIINNQQQQQQQQNNKEIDFKCQCKSKLFYGKRCENKINLCKNETCSGNGLCKLINENELNETTKCECFGKGWYEGEKCEITSLKQTIIKAVIKTTVYVAIGVVIIFFALIISMDIHKILTIKNAFNFSKKNQSAKNKPKIKKTNQK